ncbi:hypothetical protein MAR_004483 [Mya arenaria]|uniref:Uncharacterized protein n=1 Tax=Mya arenaria TaxID=6604 RepID=A0ABY7F0U9_MYAAR|nr:hypothetical protein MAR_004483 [Mya arenaria]
MSMWYEPLSVVDNPLLWVDGDPLLWVDIDPLLWVDVSEYVKPDEGQYGRSRIREKHENRAENISFSRRILWLKVANSNNNPNIIAAYFLEFVKEIGGVLRCIRMDAGTENVVVEDMQKAFRWYHGDNMAGERSVIVGSSHTNQSVGGDSCIKEGALDSALCNLFSRNWTKYEQRGRHEKEHLVESLTFYICVQNYMCMRKNSGQMENN